MKRISRRDSALALGTLLFLFSWLFLQVIYPEVNSSFVVFIKMILSFATSIYMWSLIVGVSLILIGYGLGEDK